MTLWRTLTVAWPLAISDWFWAQLGVQPQILQSLTLKRVAALFAFVALVMAFAVTGAMTMDMVVPFISDLLIYFDVVSFVLLMAARQRLGLAVRAAAEAAHGAIPRISAGLDRVLARVRRPRSHRPRRVQRTKPNDEPHAGWPGLAHATLS